MAYPVKFYGHVSVHEENGHQTFVWNAGEEVTAVAYDNPIPGFKTPNTINLRLWAAKPCQEFDLEAFNTGDYVNSIIDKQKAETITSVLYPDDKTYEGKELRLKQQHFMVSATLQVSEIGPAAQDHPRMTGHACHTLPFLLAISSTHTHTHTHTHTQTNTRVDARTHAHTLTLPHPGFCTHAMRLLSSSLSPFLPSPLLISPLQDIVRRYKEDHDSFEAFPDKVALQLNDTHPTLGIPELMRILMDENEMGWTKSWEITTKVFSFTNHTVLPEALEKWPVSLMEKLLPRHMQVSLRSTRANDPRSALS